jgi:hypothetical protein
MADGDPMMLTTQWGDGLSLISNGNFEIWTNTAAFADGWVYANYNAKTPTLSRSAGARTGGAGTYFQHVDYGTISVSGTLFGAYNRVELHGNSALPARGHLGMTFTASLWTRKTYSAGSPTVRIDINERDVNLALLNSTSGSVSNILSAWAAFTHTHVIANSATVFLEIYLNFSAPTVSSYLIDLDDAALYTSYTFARNPVIPDDQRIISPTRTFARSYAGSLFVRKVGAASARHEKRLRFGMIDLTQLKAFRSLYLLDVPMQWTPYHPHLATTLDVRWMGDFDFSVLKYLSLNMYRGSMTLAEV